MTYYIEPDSEKVLLNGYGENVAFMRIRHLLLGEHKPKPFHISTRNLRGFYARQSMALNRDSWLPNSDAVNLQDAFATSGLIYVIFSFDTPIAWQNGNQWVIPDVRYSQRTSHHQGTIRAAIQEYGE